MLYRRRRSISRRPTRRITLTIEGLKKRDELVFRVARARDIPVMVTFAGGYARNVEDTVTIHSNTVIAAKEVFELERTDDHAKDILDGMIVSPSDLSHKDLYSILLNSVAPRPIAWVSTVSASGRPNLAPFSFFNCVCVDPPLLAFAPALRRPKQADAGHGEAKDTLRNIREIKEFVVNIVTLRTGRGDEYDQR